MSACLKWVVTEYHPDRLGTKLITNPSTNTAKEQGTLPYGTALDSETTANTNQKFTSYDRSDKTGLDYAVNRIYSSEQARFLQPDPIGMASADLTDPQSLNMYIYARDNPIDFTDPSGLFPQREVCEPRFERVTNAEGDLVDIYLAYDCYTVYDPVKESSERGLSYGLGSPDEYDCKFPRFNQLTPAQQSVLGKDGKKKYGELSNRHRANFLNLTARAAQIGLDFTNLIADPRKHVDRLILTGKTGLPKNVKPADILKASHEAAVKARKMSDSPPTGHGDMNKYGGRQEGLTYSLQLGINASRTRAFVDIDYYNPDNGLLGAGLHLGEVIWNWVRKRKTDAFRVGKHLGSKLTKYDCKKRKK